MSDEGRKSINLFISPELHSRHNEVADEKYEGVTKADAIGRVLMEKLADL
jgi:hypothetical protein